MGDNRLVTQKLLLVLDILSHKSKSRSYLEHRMTADSHGRDGYIFMLRWMFRQQDKRRWQQIVAAVVDLAVCVDLNPPMSKPTRRPRLVPRQRLL